MFPKIWFMTLATFLLPFYASANDRIPTEWFNDWTKHEEIAKAAAPIWHFGRPTGRSPCYPEDAIQPDGSQTHGSPMQPVQIWKGCAWPGEWKQPYSPGNPFTTYWTIRHCSHDNTYRVTYSIYFKQDAGHMSDWEWVSVVWAKDAGSETWFRWTLLQSYHKGEKAESWNDIESTIHDESDIYTFGEKGRNHPKVYVGAFKHAMFTTKKTTIDTAATTPGDEFRSDDWYWYAASKLDKGEHIPREWNWGAARSAPLIMFDEICERWSRPASG